MTEVIATRRDLDEQNIDKVFPRGFAADHEREEGKELTTTPNLSIMARPEFGVNDKEINACKMMAMCGPLIPQWLRTNPGYCWGIIQLSKRWTRYSYRTNSWIHFDPVTIAQATYMVISHDGVESVAYMSSFIRALIDAFANTEKAMRYTYGGEGELRTCTCFALLRGEDEVHAYTTPPLRQIHPKRSPLWASDPDRQLAYYASRAWARLYASGVLHGVYDEEELDAERMPNQATRLSPPAEYAPAPDPVSGLHERLRRAQAAQDPQSPREGYREGVVEQALEPKPEPQKPPSDTAEPARAKKARRATRHRAEPKDAPTATPSPPEPPSDEDREPIQGVYSKEEMRAARAPEPPARDEKAPKAPKNLAQYIEHVRRWLMELTTEQAIEERFRAERGLRNQCGVTADDRISIRASYIDQRIQELRGGRDDEERET